MSRERFKCFVQLRDFATGLAGPLMAWWSPPAIDQLVQSKLVLSQQCHSGRCLGLPTTGPCFQQGWSLLRAPPWFFNQAFLFDIWLCHKHPSVGHPWCPWLWNSLVMHWGGNLQMLSNVAALTPFQKNFCSVPCGLAVMWIAWERPWHCESPQLNAITILS